MKTVITLLLVVIFIGACKKEDPPQPSNNTTNTQTVTPPPPPPPPVVDYWGCWREATGKLGYKDLILIENQSEPHTVQVGISCIKDPAIPSQDIGVFRNDTLILDNGTFEYWCFIVGDTLIYGVYVPNTDTDKFIKI